MNKSFVKQYPAYKTRGSMTAAQWVQSWQTRFALLEVEVLVADVGQSSVFLDMAERKVVLAPSLNLYQAEKMLRAIYNWWRYRPEGAKVVCAFA